MNETDSEAEILRDILPLVRAINRQKSVVVTANSSFMTELDFDSLQMLELFSSVERQFEVNLIAAGAEVGELKTPQDIARMVGTLRKGA